MFRRTAATSVMLAMAAMAIAAQMSPERERARPHFRAGWEYMRVEAWAEAAQSFEQAIEVDHRFEDAYYSLGRARMNLKKFAEAIEAYTRSRDLYREQAGRMFTSQADAQRFRQDRITELDEVLRQLQSGPQTRQVQERTRQVQEQRRQIQQYIQRGATLSIDNSIPAFVSLALGSAYFRSGKLADAEREYKAAIDADPKAGEAHSNLAVVYLETGRFAEAEQAVKAAERAGFKVHPQLKQDIKDRRKGTGS
ncbi:MAG: tetratricopeptide repeat protein [Vicinamibacterales bacterium]